MLEETRQTVAGSSAARSASTRGRLPPPGARAEDHAAGERDQPVQRGVPAVPGDAHHRAHHPGAGEVRLLIEKGTVDEDGGAGRESGPCSFPPASLDLTRRRGAAE